MWCRKYPISSCCIKASRANRQGAASTTNTKTLSQEGPRKTHSPSQRLRKGGGHANTTDSQYDAHVRRDLDWEDPAWPRQHPSRAAMLLLLAASSSATDAAAFFVVSYSIVLIFMSIFVSLYCHRAGASSGMLMQTSRF